MQVGLAIPLKNYRRNFPKEQIHLDLEPKDPAFYDCLKLDSFG